MALRNLVVRESELRHRPRVIGWSEAVGREGGGLVVLVILFGALALASDSFLTSGNLANLSRQWAVFGIIAIGELLVILTKGIDLSVGSVVGLTGAVVAQLLVAGFPVPVAMVLAVLVGAAVGVVNGALVAYAKLPPFIVTLGMMGAARGLTLVITDANTIQPLPDSFGAIANDTVGGLPNLLIITVVVIILAGFLLRRTVFGRYVYAAGSNAESARLSGVPVPRVLVTVYAMSGLLAGLAGVLLASRLGAGVPTAGESYELDAIAACVIGGASLFGAKGSAIGAAAGALITSTLNNGGNLLGINSFYLQIAIGVLILLAVAFDQLQGRLSAREPQPIPETDPPSGTTPAPG
ncbi:ABC transporter permease [Amycolatopsis acidicola]|uniref:ABC transporter permease n=1 Tax=Amycolatopsis acidicola TaxID=2596893 RepID=A0A5N0URR9_9PSEU|nr:ABC transporter permease [Amycolatopsis acidicola]KAA9151334.1 ABC transporter permease [Amycolatopsis acidicola]